jgi:hypothetical protein
MKARWTLAGAALLALGCNGRTVDLGADTPIFIRDALAPPASTAGGICTYSADPAQPTLSIGTLDVALASNYEVTLLVGNVGAARFAISGAVVAITDALGNQLSTYTLATSQTLDPAAGPDPSYASIALIAVDPETIARFGGLPGTPALPATDSVVTLGSRQQVISTIKLYGNTLGGEYAESNVFSFPIEMCMGCLVEGLVENACFSVGSTTPPPSGPCIVGQDQPVDCSLCQGAPICQCGETSCTGAQLEPVPDGG